uniref:TRAF-type domain-containing protein n=2 Tax=Clytia hemisphaerica TaxID=252671 RepID=A0A7M6DQF3_9CNID
IGMVDRMVRASVDVKCKQHERGCKWEGKIIDYKAHEETCQYVMVKCKNDGCHEERIRKNMKRHQQKCQYIIKNCVHCGTQKMFIELKEHYTNCPMMEITCTNDECDVQVLRHE